MVLLKLFLITHKQTLIIAPLCDDKVKISDLSNNFIKTERELVILIHNLKNMGQGSIISLINNRTMLNWGHYGTNYCHSISMEAM